MPLETAQGEPLWLVPGLMCDHAVWSGVMAHLGFKAKGVVVPDHGLCDDIVGMAQQILASVPGALAVAGHSMGGRVALEMRRLAPQRVQHLALLEKTPLESFLKSKLQ